MEGKWINTSWVVFGLFLFGSRLEAWRWSQTAPELIPVLHANIQKDKHSSSWYLQCSPCQRGHAALPYHTFQPLEWEHQEQLLQVYNCEECYELGWCPCLGWARFPNTQDLCFRRLLKSWSAGCLTLQLPIEYFPWGWCHWALLRSRGSVQTTGLLYNSHQAVVWGAGLVPLLSSEGRGQSACHLRQWRGGVGAWQVFRLYWLYLCCAELSEHAGSAASTDLQVHIESGIVGIISLLFVF